MDNALDVTLAAIEAPQPARALDVTRAGIEAPLPAAALDVVFVEIEATDPNRHLDVFFAGIQAADPGVVSGESVFGMFPDRKLEITIPGQETPEMVRRKRKKLDRPTNEGAPPPSTDPPGEPEPPEEPPVQETVATPTISPNGGTFEGPTSLTFSTPTADALLRYTLDGTDPTTGSPLYLGPFALEASATVKVRGFKEGAISSAVASAVFTINAIAPPPDPEPETVATPVITPAGGTFDNQVGVIITCAESHAAIRVTEDDTEPTVSSTLYSGAFSKTTSGPVKAKAFLEGMLDSVTASASFTINEVEEPPIDVGGTTVTVPDTITGDGVTNVDAEIQAWLDSVGDGVNIYIPHVYRFDTAGPIFNRRHDIKLFGPGGFTTPTDGYEVAPPPTGSWPGWPRTRKRSQFNNCQRFLIQDILLEGSNQANTELKGYVEPLEGQHGIELQDCQDFLIGNKEGETGHGVRIRFVRGDFIMYTDHRRTWLEDGTSRPRFWSERITVRGNGDLGNPDFHHNGRQGHAIVAVRDLLVESVVHDYMRRTQIDIEPDGQNQGVQRLRFKNNDFGLAMLTWLTIHRRGTLEDLTLDTNTIRKAQVLTPTSSRDIERGWTIPRIQRLHLLGNVSTQKVNNPQNCAWKLNGVDGLKVVGNDIALHETMYLCCLNDCTNPEVHDNDVNEGVGEVKETV